ncbi:MAG: hypothetical protein JXR25_08775 [Pontiellaceae bacterium]|nr:hypothetical protein [Pontiellaceae bacterium]MBN2784908.1 hypothetical protein [Pontiellaceae bacterium]
MKNFPKRKSGQAMVEYIIIVVVIAVAAMVLFGALGKVIQKKTKGAIEQLDGEVSKDDMQSADQYIKDFGNEE